MTPHVIRQGEYLTQLAARMGFDASEVWNHAANRELRARRPNPDVLHPGDVLRVPAPRRAGASLSPHTTNRYRARLARVEVRIQLLDVNGQACSDKAFSVLDLPQEVRGRTDADGRAVFSVPVNTGSVRLVVGEPPVTYRVHMGHLDPASERSGARRRLQQLGYLGALAAAEGEPWALALAAFQRAHGLPATGTLDEATQQALTSAHGS
jgi:N-acetylmuramoyl-L-alanine amidase